MRPTLRKIVFITGGAVFVLLTAWLWYWFSYGGRAASLAESADPRERIQAVDELSEKGSGLAGRTLRRMPDDPDPEVARRAVRALGRRRDPASRQVLEAVLSGSRQAEVRAEAASALGHYPETDLAILTATLSADPEPTVREGAATGLAARKDISAIPDLLVRMEHDRDLYVRKSSYLALRRTVKVRFMYDAAASPQRRSRQVEAIRSILSRFDLL